MGTHTFSLLRVTTFTEREMDEGRTRCTLIFFVAANFVSCRLYAMFDSRKEQEHGIPDPKVRKVCSILT